MDAVGNGGLHICFYFNFFPLRRKDATGLGI